MKFVLTLIVLCLAFLTQPALADAPAKKATVGFAEIQPIFREHCLSCHNQSKKKGGLALDTYAATMEGGASGEVVYAADLESSRLWHLVNHEDEPTMPPNQDRMAQPKLDLIAKWINEGAAEQAGAAIKKAKKPTLQFQPADIDDGSPGAMPGKICKQPVEVTSRASAVSALAASPRAPLIAVAGQRQVVLYHSETSELLGILPYPEGTPHVIRFSRDGGMLLIAGGRGAKIGNVALHDVVTGKRLTTIGDELDVVLAADIDRTLSYVVLGGPQKLVRIYSAGSGEMLYEMDKHTDWVTAAEFSPDGKFLATGDRAGGLVVWEAETGREYQVCDGHKKQITAISWRGDSKVFATSSEEGNIRIWNPESRKQIKNWGHGGGAIQVTYARDGNLFSVGRDRRVKRWDGNGKNTNNYDPFADIAMCVCASHDSKRVFAGDWTGTIRGFQIASPKPMTTLAANPSSIQDRLAAAKSQLQTDFDAIGKQRQQVEAARKKYFEVRPAYLEVIYRLTNSEKQARETLAKVADLQRQLQQDPPDEQSLRNQLKAHTNRLANLNQQVANHARQFAGPLKNLNVASLDVRDMRRKVRTAQQSHRAQQNVCRMIGDELAEFNRQPKELQQILTATESRIASQQKQIDQTRMTLAALQTAKPAASAEPTSSDSDTESTEANATESTETGEAASAENTEENPESTPDNTAELTRLSDLLVKLESDLANMEAKAAEQSAALEFWNASYSK